MPLQRPTQTEPRPQTDVDAVWSGLLARMGPDLPCAQPAPRIRFETRWAEWEVVDDALFADRR